MQDSLPGMFTRFVRIVVEWYGSLRKCTTGRNSVVCWQTWQLTCQVREIWTTSWTSPHTRNFRTGFPRFPVAVLLLLLSLLLSREVSTDEKDAPGKFGQTIPDPNAKLPCFQSFIFFWLFVFSFLVVSGLSVVISVSVMFCDAQSPYQDLFCDFFASSLLKGLPSRTTLWTRRWFLWWESCGENVVESASWHSSIRCSNGRCQVLSKSTFSAIPTR